MGGWNGRNSSSSGGGAGDQVGERLSCSGWVASWRAAFSLLGAAMETYRAGEDGQGWLSGGEADRNSETERDRRTDGGARLGERSGGADGGKGGDQATASWWPAKGGFTQGERGEREPVRWRGEERE
ncbi:uncharacterized protein LOC130137886 [Syzygium oleosum]|uniref:uncharacterized protein LOC130137886 n=1 Tax=Syzygium oleosum TaxID=219896 RepID=UPI0024B964A8|nr:uncharacterized protein LOC130137886 [Syzygium oleosum]